jgi:hypothetical protein
MFLGEVFQEVKFWRWLMDIRKLKVMVFRQITLPEIEPVDKA